MQTLNEKNNLLFSIKNMDCIEYLKTVQDNYFDLCITSPPYNIGNKYTEYKDKLSEDEYHNFLTKVINELIRTCKYTSFNIQYNKNNRKVVWSIFGDFKNHIKDLMIWYKPTGQPSNINCLINNYELIFIFKKDTKTRSYEKDLKGATTAFNAPNNGASNQYAFNTPENEAIMAIQVSDMMVELFSKPGDLIFDPFCGSGTTGVSAIKAGRRFVGTDISTTMCEISEDRITTATKQRKLIL